MTPELSRDADGLPSGRRGLALTVLIIGTIMAVLDSSIANIALPTLARELRIDAAQSVWVVNAYQVAVTMLLLPFASLGDVLGLRKIYTMGIVIFSIGSLGCALSTTLAALLVWRIVQGIGAAALMSIAPALMRTIFPAAMLGTAVGISALTVASSTAAGPTIGGVILAVAPWPWLFAINVPLGLFDTILAARVLPRTPGTGARFDIPSALLSGPALALLVVGLDGIGRHVAAPIVGAMIVASVALGVAFVRRQRKLAAPMLPLDLFAIPRFSLAATTSLCSFTAQGLAFVALPFLFQGAYGYSAFVSGLLFTPWPLAIAVVAPLAGRLSDRVSSAKLATAGLATFAIGLLLLANLGAHPLIIDIVWRAIVCGAGFGFFQAPNNRELLGSAPRNRSGSAGGILATVRLTGQSLGAAVVAIVLGTATVAAASGSALASAASLSSSAHLALGMAAAVAAVAAIVSGTRLARDEARVVRSRTPVR
jgi:DHA2 family multidrug resistance protein-like MFS transporter